MTPLPESFHFVKYGSSNIPSNIQLLILNIYFFYSIISLDQNQSSLKNANITDCLKKYIWKLLKQNKLFDGIYDVIFDNPYLTEHKDSTIETQAHAIFHGYHFVYSW